MDIESFRRRCEARLHHITFPDPFTLRTFVDTVSDWQARSITLVPSPMPPGLHGLLVPEGSTDYLFYRADATPLHRRHIILHELGHILCGHSGLAIDSASSLRDLITAPEGLAALAAQYSLDEEQEADVFAALVLERTEGDAVPSTAHHARTAHTLRLLHDLTGMRYGF